MLKQLLEDKNIDICGIGEGEVTITEIIKKLIISKGKKLDDIELNEIDGIAYNKDNHSKSLITQRKVKANIISK